MTWDEGRRYTLESLAQYLGWGRERHIGSRQGSSL